MCMFSVFLVLFVFFHVFSEFATVQMHICKMTGYAQLPLGVNGHVNVCMHGALQ